MNRVVSLFLFSSFAALTSGCGTGPSLTAYDLITPVDGGQLPPEMTRFGGEITGDLSDTVMVSEVLTDPALFEGELIRVQGVVIEVCKPKGCWITLGIPETPERGVLFVKFVCPVGDDRLVPIDAPGQVAVVEGQLERVEITEAFARHLAEDAGHTPEQIAAITGPQPLIRLSSPAAMIDCKPFTSQELETDS